MKKSAFATIISTLSAILRSSNATSTNWIHQKFKSKLLFAIVSILLISSTLLSADESTLIPATAVVVGTDGLEVTAQFPVHSGHRYRILIKGRLTYSEWANLITEERIAVSCCPGLGGTGGIFPNLFTIPDDQYFGYSEIPCADCTEAGIYRSIFQLDDQNHHIEYFYDGLKPGINNSVAFLAFPLDCSAPQCSDGFEYLQGAYTENSVISVVDHHVEVIYKADGTVISWTDEIGEGKKYKNGCYPNIETGVPFSVAGTYIGSITPSKKGVEDCGPSGGLNYDGHPGFDYKANYGTPVKAAAVGVVVSFGKKLDRCIPKGIKAGCGAWGAVGIDHENGYTTQYLHLSEIFVEPGQSVQKGMIIGLSGNESPNNTYVGPHLHFEVLRLVPDSAGESITDFKVVDPYGWDGCDQCDFLEAVTGIENTRLWE